MSVACVEEDADDRTLAILSDRPPSRERSPPRAPARRTVKRTVEPTVPWRIARETSFGRADRHAVDRDDHVGRLRACRRPEARAGRPRRARRSGSPAPSARARGARPRRRSAATASSSARSTCRCSLSLRPGGTTSSGAWRSAPSCRPPKQPLEQRRLADDRRRRSRCRRRRSDRGRLLTLDERRHGMRASGRKMYCLRREAPEREDADEQDEPDREQPPGVKNRT